MRRLTIACALLVGCGGGGSGDATDDPADASLPAPDAATPPGAGVALDVGHDGGAYDIDAAALAALFEGAGATVTTITSQPADLADDVAGWLVLSPTSGFPDPAPAQALLARGGTVVVVTEHSGYGDHAGATAYLADLGCTLASLGGLRSGTQALSVGTVAGVTDGVAALTLFYGAEIDLGADGVAVATYDDGAPAIGTEQVGAGRVVLVPDGSFFGYVLDEADNRTLLLNLRP